MRVRPHLAHHEAIGDLPLLTESAVVTSISAMDRSRTGAVLAELRSTLDAAGNAAWARERPADDAACDDWLGEQLDPVDHVAGGTPLDRFLPESRRTGALDDKLAALQARYLQPYPSLLRIAVETDDPVAFLPGQYLSVHYRKTTRVYSIASSPAREEIEFCVRRVPGGRMTSDLAVDLEVGDTVTLRGPYGEFLLEAPSPRDVVFLATGTGIAPLRSMVEYLIERGWDRFAGATRDVWVILGAAWEDELPYRHAFRSLSDAHGHVHFVPTLSRESFLTDWTGETAYVQYTLVKYLSEAALDDRDLPTAFEPYRDEPPRYPIDARIDPANVEVYACGRSAMVYSLVEAVDRLGVPPRHTQFEGFG